MGQKHAKISWNAKSDFKPDLQCIKKSEPCTLDYDDGQRLLVSARDAAQKIEKYPEAIQKLVWRALYYKREIKTRQPAPLGIQNGEYEKLTKYIVSFRHAQNLILKMCKKRDLKPILIDGGS